MKRLLLALPIILAACASDVPNPTEAFVAKSAVLAAKGGTCTLASGRVVATGFDQYGYNRCAHIFNGTYGGWCAQHGQGPDCGGVQGSTTLVMKWNEEWDRGNATNWNEGPYDAWEDNEAKGAYLDGTTFSEHFKTKWDAGCVAVTTPADPMGYTYRPDGGKCIWGQFLVLMDQGKEDGQHMWWAKLSPAGYGN